MARSGSTLLIEDVGGVRNPQHERIYDHLVSNPHLLKEAVQLVAAQAFIFSISAVPADNQEIQFVRNARQTVLDNLLIYNAQLGKELAKFTARNKQLQADLDAEKDEIQAAELRARKAHAKQLVDLAERKREEAEAFHNKLVAAQAQIETAATKPKLTGEAPDSLVYIGDEESELTDNAGVARIVTEYFNHRPDNQDAEIRLEADRADPNNLDQNGVLNRPIREQEGTREALNRGDTHVIKTKLTNSDGEVTGALILQKSERNRFSTTLKLNIPAITAPETDMANHNAQVTATAQALTRASNVKRNEEGCLFFKTTIPGDEFLRKAHDLFFAQTKNNTTFTKAAMSLHMGKYIPADLQEAIIMYAMLKGYYRPLDDDPKLRIHITDQTKRIADNISKAQLNMLERRLSAPGNTIVAHPTLEKSAKGKQEILDNLNPPPPEPFYDSFGM